MTALPGNTYEAEANVGRDYFEDVDNFRLAQATLALAYEQRTANLIAMWSSPEAKSGNATWGVSESTIGAILQEILERLGLK